jgi:hypothetical protein
MAWRRMARRLAWRLGLARRLGLPRLGLARSRLGLARRLGSRTLLARLLGPRSLQLIAQTKKWPPAQFPAAIPSLREVGGPHGVRIGACGYARLALQRRVNVCCVTSALALSHTIDWQIQSGKVTPRPSRSDSFDLGGFDALDFDYRSIARNFSHWSRAGADIPGPMPCRYFMPRRRARRRQNSSLPQDP